MLNSLKCEYLIFSTHINIFNPTRPFQPLEISTPGNLCKFPKYLNVVFLSNKYIFFVDIIIILTVTFLNTISEILSVELKRSLNNSVLFKSPEMIKKSADEILSI